MPANESGLLKSYLLSRHGFAHGFSLRHTDPDLALRALAIDPRRVYQATQVHGSAVLVAEGDPALMRGREADALVAATADAAVAVRVADCVPLLVGAMTSGDAVAIHAGWRGITRGVIPEALAELHRLVRGSGTASRDTDLVAAIGPCIGPCCFEVGSVVADQIAAVSSQAVVVSRGGDKAHVDLRRAVRLQLRSCGLRDDSIEDVAGCTKHEPDRFFSYRRDGANAGRQLGIIAHLKPGNASGSREDRRIA